MTTSQRPPRKGLPAASTVGLVFLILALLVPTVFSHRLLNSDGDVARHLVLGRHVMEHGIAFPDPFSHTRAGETFTAYEWLSEVLFALAEGLAGLPGVVALGGLIIAGSLALVAAYLRPRLEPLYAIPAVFVAAALTGPHWIARPHLFSFLALSALLVLATRRPDLRRHVGLGVLFAFWANLHPGFLYGLAILGAYLVGRVVEDRRRLGPAVASLGAASLGTLVNPLGWGLHLSIVHHLQDQRAFEMVDEFQRIDVTSGYGILFVGVVLTLAVLLLGGRRDLGASTLLTVGAGLAAALVAQRNAPLFGLFALPVGLAAVGGLLGSWRWARLEKFRETLVRDDRRGTTRPWVGAGVGVGVLFAAVLAREPDLYPSASGFDPDVFPVEAVARAQEEGLGDLRMFNAYAWGGYILHAWPEQRIYIDGMANFFGSDLMEEYVSVINGVPGWEERIRERGIDLLLVPPQAPLVAEAVASGEWRLLHSDETASLLVREDPPGPEPAGTA